MTLIKAYNSSMKITKYAHACLILEENGQRLVIDPGDFTELPEDLANIVAVLVTHVHGDHLGKSNIAKIVAANPDVVIVAGSDSLAELAEVQAAKEEVAEDCEKAFGGFKLRLRYIDHAVIYQQPPCKNITAIINGKLYCPGDSLMPCDGPVDVVAVPVNAPWSKAGELAGYINNSSAKIYFPLHNGLLNDIGQTIYNTWAQRFVAEAGKTYTVLEPGQSLEV